MHLLPSPTHRTRGGSDGPGGGRPSTTGSSEDHVLPVVHGDRSAPHEQSVAMTKPVEIRAPRSDELRAVARLKIEWADVEPRPDQFVYTRTRTAENCGMVFISDELG